MKHSLTKRILISLSILMFYGGAICAQLNTTHFRLTDGIQDEVVKGNIENNVTYLLSVFNKAAMDGKKIVLPETGFTQDARTLIPDIWKSGAIVCSLAQLERKCLTLPNNQYQIREIPVTMLAAPQERQNQEIVITLTSKGDIDNVTVALAEHQYTDILANHYSVSDFNKRQIIVDFVENFRTAYNRKDLDYLQAIFSDNALIITGKVIKEKPNSDTALKSLSNEKIVYLKQSKKSYLAGLKKVFSKNKYIDVQFEDIEVLSHTKNPKVYGVTLKQDWKSSTYMDTGFVFLMIDFSDELQPFVQVRTWQPEKINGVELRRDEIFSFNSINI